MRLCFFDSDILGVIDSLYYLGVDLFASGLDRDFRSLYFPLRDYGTQTANEETLNITMEHVINQFEEVIQHYSFCDVCGNKAGYTQRLINGKPAPADSPLILIGDTEYQARCKKHYV